MLTIHGTEPLGDFPLFPHHLAAVLKAHHHTSHSHGLLGVKAWFQTPVNSLLKLTDELGRLYIVQLYRGR
jgi:hypothetical protein